MALSISKPELHGPVGKQKASKSYHFLSHVAGGCREEEVHIQSSNGLLKGAPWLSGDNIYDVNDFWLCAPNSTFELIYHTPSWGYSVYHYYKAELIDGCIIELKWLGQYSECSGDNNYDLYQIGDEKIKPKKKWWYNYLKMFI